MRRRGTDKDLAIHDLDRQLEHHRQQPENRRHGRQNDRAETHQPGTEGRLARPVAAARIFIVGVDQNNVVVHDNAGERDHPEPAHHDAEGLVGRPQAQNDATCRQQDGRHRHEGLPARSELQHQNNHHQRQGQRE